jgi:hypothetical protein
MTITGTRSITVTNPAPGGGTSNLASVNVTAHAIYLPLIARNP